MSGVLLTRTIAKVILVGCVGLWLWQIISITIAKNEINDIERQITIAKAELTHNQNKMDMLEAEVKEKNSFGSCVAIFSESFMNGFTFGLFDDEGIFGVNRRLERWEADVRSRAVEYQTGIDNANAAVTNALARHQELSLSLPKKAVARNLSGAFAVVSILILVFVPLKQGGQ